MSYEGSIQCLCVNGHLSECDANWHYSQKRLMCPTCKKKVVWQNGVDDTNCDSCGRIPDKVFDKVFKIADPVYETICKHCKSQRLVFPERYRIPTKEEQKALQCYFDSTKWAYIYLNGPKKGKIAQKLRKPRGI